MTMALSLLVAACRVAPEPDLPPGKRTANDGGSVPVLDAHVTDTAQVLPASVERELELRIAALEAGSNVQMAILTVPSLGAEDLETYSLRAAETAQLGMAGADNGLLIVIVPAERRVRVEVGYGLEGSLTDVEAGAIIDQAMRPSFQRGDLAGGLVQALDALELQLHESGDGVVKRGREVGGAAVQPPEGPSILAGMVVLAAVMAIGVLLPYGAGWILYGLGMILVLYAFVPYTFPVGALFVGTWLFGFPIVRERLRNEQRGLRPSEVSASVHGYWRTGPRPERGYYPGTGSRGGYADAQSTPSASGSGGAGSAGSLSGGGGDFGGGGASGSW
jgi:uncharacterized protein